MTQEEKQLLIRDLCVRLPYGVICFAPDSEYGDVGKLWCIEPFEDLDPTITIQYPKGNTITKFCSEVKPYLRPMSSMTEEEFEQLKQYSGLEYDQLDLAEFPNNHKCLDFYLSEVPSYAVILVFDWLNAHHFDYRLLIERGLALEATEGMYKTE